MGRMASPPHIFAVLLLTTTRFAAAHTATSSTSHAAKLAQWRLPSEACLAASAATDSIRVSPGVLPAARAGTIVAAVASTAPTADDWLAVYSPASADVTALAPIEFFNVLSADPAYLQSNGSALVHFRLVNLRTDFVLALFHSHPTNGTHCALSNTVRFANPNFPRAARLMSSGGPPDEMAVTWSSELPAGTPRVSVRLAGSRAPWLNSSATTATYAPDDLCGPPATGKGRFDVGSIHTALMTGLVPLAHYEYVVGADDATTEVQTFVQPPAPGQARPGGFGFAIYGDMGQVPLDGSNASVMMPPAPNVSVAISRDIDAGVVQYVSQIGDLSYAMGYEVVWDLYLDMLDSLAIPSRVCFATLQGNHELLWPSAGRFGPSFYPGQTDSGGECGIPAAALFPNPDRLPYYVVKVGLVTMIHFCAELDFSTGSAQWDFIRASLLAVNTTETPWTLLLTHRPMYGNIVNSSSPQSSVRVAGLLRQHLEPLFHHSGSGELAVDAVFGGHFHEYQRSCAAFGGRCVQHSSAGGVYASPPAPVHFLVGTAGADLSCCHNATTPEYTETAIAAHGYGRMWVANATHLRWQFVSAAAGNAVLDEAWIVKAGRGAGGEGRGI